ncbi:MAG: undecaprenyl-diphosphate phosphatase [Bacilli bacterium]
MIEYLKYIVLGIVQGISEILPISSSGHTVLTERLLNLQLASEDLALLSVFMHFASLIAIVVFFWKEIWLMIKHTFLYLFGKDKEKRSEYREGLFLFLYVVVASVPVGLVGLLLADKVTEIFGKLLIIGIFFVVNGLILLFVGLFKKAAPESEFGWKNIMITGLFQCIGVLPGISRSGITMSGAKIAGLDDEKAKKFAFLLFLPVSAGSFVFSLPDLVTMSTDQTHLLPYFVVATIFSLGFTFLALFFIFKKFHFGHYKWFAIYMFMVGLFTIIYSVVI